MRSAVIVFREDRLSRGEGRGGEDGRVCDGGGCGEGFEYFFFSFTFLVIIFLLFVCLEA